MSETKLRIGRWRWEILWEPRDCWIGVYWTRGKQLPSLDIYVCVLPCLPLHVYWGMA